MATSASPAFRFVIAQGLFDACQLEAQACVAQLDPYLMTGEAVPLDLEEQLRGSRARLTEAKANMDAAKVANDSAMEVCADTAKLAVAAPAPETAVVVEYTRIPEPETDPGGSCAVLDRPGAALQWAEQAEHKLMLHHKFELEDVVSIERARATNLQRELLEMQAHKRRLEQDLARSAERMVIVERRAATAELSMGAEADLRLNLESTNESDRVRDMQLAYEHARGAAREHRQSFDVEKAQLVSQVQKAREHEQEAALLLVDEQLQRIEAEATIRKEREDTAHHQRRTDEEISNLTAALRDAVGEQRGAEARARYERESHNRVQDQADAERCEAAAAAGAAKTAAAAVTRLVEQARSQEAAEGRRAASLEATLHEVKIELAEERNKRALTEAAESLGREKISVLEADAQEAAAVRLTATAARDVMTGHRRSLEEALGASKQALSASTHENGQLRNAADADANAAAMLKATADTLLDRAEWAEGEVKRLTRAAVTERDETMDVKRQVADLTRAMSTSSTKQENVLAETSRLECEVLQLTFQLEQLRSKLQDTEASEASTQARLDDYADEARQLRTRMAGSVRASMDMGEERATAAEEEAHDANLALVGARAEVRELMDKITAMRDRHADALMKLSGEKAAVVAAAATEGGVGTELRHELDMLKAQLVTAHAAKMEAGDEVAHLRHALEVLSKQVAAAEFQATERQEAAVAAQAAAVAVAVVNTERLAACVERKLVAGFNSKVQELGEALQAATAKYKAEAAIERDRADAADAAAHMARETAHMARETADRAQHTLHAGNDADLSRRFAVGLREANTRTGDDRHMAAADPVVEMSEVRRQAASDRDRALVAERGLERQAKLAEIATFDAARAAARAEAAEEAKAAAEDRAAAAESKAAALQAVLGEIDEMALTEQRAVDMKARPAAVAATATSAGVEEAAAETKAAPKASQERAAALEAQKVAEASQEKAAALGAQKVAEASQEKAAALEAQKVVEAAASAEEAAAKESAAATATEAEATKGAAADEAGAGAATAIARKAAKDPDGAAEDAVIAQVMKNNLEKLATTEDADVAKAAENALANEIEKAAMVLTDTEAANATTYEAQAQAGAATAAAADQVKVGIADNIQEKGKGGDGSGDDLTVGRARDVIVIEARGSTSGLLQIGDDAATTPSEMAGAAAGSERSEGLCKPAAAGLLGRAVGMQVRTLGQLEQRQKLSSAAMSLTGTFTM